MEYVSVLAGAPFSDRPKCTDPTLAELVRLVNDVSSDEGRDRLADLAPALAASPRRRPLEATAAVHAVVAVAYDAMGGHAELERHLRRNGRRLERVMGTDVPAALARMCDVLYRQGPGRRRMTAAVVALTRLPDRQRDAAPRAALDAAITAVQAAPAPARRRCRSGRPADPSGCPPAPDERCQSRGVIPSARRGTAV